MTTALEEPDIDNTSTLPDTAPTDSIRVEKRDGRIVDYDARKIVSAISKAYKDVGIELTGQTMSDIEAMTSDVEAQIRNHYRGPAKISDIQNLVEQSLIAHHNYDVSKAYTQYRLDRDINRAKATDVNEAVKRFVNHDPTIAHENANKDSNVYSTQRDLLAGAVSKAAAFDMLPAAVSNAHMKGDIHFHDADYSPFTAQSNCSLPNFDEMMAHGFTLGNAPMASPKSIAIAATQITQIMKDVASSQYGGQTANRIDERFAKYAKLDYKKYLEEANDVMPDDIPLDIARRQVAKAKEHEPSHLHFEHRNPIPDDVAFHTNASELEQLREIYAKIRTRKAIYDAMQTMEYQINSNRVSNGQTPFVTVGFGLGTDWFAREIQRAILLNRIRGLGKSHQTPIFPKLVFTIKHGINADKGDPNYDMKQLALECSTKRMYPDVVFYENIVKITGSFKAPMGCVAGHEIVSWHDANESKTHTEGIERMWKSLALRYPVKQQKNTGNSDYYIDIPESDKVTIKDSHTGKVQFIPVKRIVQNANREWRRIIFNNGRIIDCTPDHPFEVKGKGRVIAENLQANDEIAKSVEKQQNTSHYYNENIAWLLGVIICDGCLNENTETLISTAAKGEDEIEDRIRAIICKDNIRIQNHDRGQKGIYKEIVIKDKAIHTLCVSEFDGTIKADRRIPDSIFLATRKEKVAFMAGMIDADGYIHKKSQHVMIGSTNKELAIGQMLLAESLGYATRMYQNFYRSGQYEYIRYRVEFRATNELVDEIACAKKRNSFNSNIRINKSDDTITVKSVEVIEPNEPSYDVTTESDYFDVSGIVSHNCRSFLQGWVNPKTGEDEEDGRMNLGVVSVNIPRIAMESHNDKNEFYRLLDERLEIAHQALQFRIMRCKQAKPVNAPTLFMYGAFGRLKADESVDQLFNNERATVSLGYIGLAEATSVFYGKDWIQNHSWNPEGKQFALSIVRRMNDLCKQWSKAEGYHYSVYSTPAESLTDRFNRLDREKFGRVEGVTDHDFYTNSFHYPVWLSPTPMEKLDYEKDFPYYASGGFINYCEFPCLQSNPKALEAVWDYAYNIGIGYLGTNTPIDHCYECGYEGDFEPTEVGFKCPECGNHDPTKCDVTKRTCGYLGNPVQRPMAHGRHEEIIHRVKHMSGETGHVVLPDGENRDWYEDAK